MPSIDQRYRTPSSCREPASLPDELAEVDVGEAGAIVGVALGVSGDGETSGGKVASAIFVSVAITVTASSPVVATRLQLIRIENKTAIANSLFPLVNMISS